jgi:transposase
MAPVNRKQPKRAPSSESSFSVMEFIRDFPDDDACLEWLWRTRHATTGDLAYCERCGVERRLKRYETTRRRQAWTCTSCSLAVYPTAGTIFHKSSTSLHLWFYAMWIITSTRCGVSAKQLERELGVTYKTAWRMFNKIRNELMVQDYQGPLSGTVEADETWIGGKMRHSESVKRKMAGLPQRGPYTKKRETTFGMVQRGGQVIALHVPSRYGYALRANIRRTVTPDSIVYTDDYGGYTGLDRVYSHDTIAHSHKVYVAGDVHTQTIEGFFSLVKNGIRGVYHVVSPKWLQGYLNEYAWRYNHRDDGRSMFLTLLLRAATPSG